MMSSLLSMQYAPKEFVNLLLSVLFLGLGVSALTRAAWSVGSVAGERPLTLPPLSSHSAIIDPLLPHGISSRLTHYHLKLTKVHPNQKKGEI